MKAYSVVRARRTAAEVWSALHTCSLREVIEGYEMHAAFEHTCEGGPQPLPRWRYVIPALWTLACIRCNSAICAAVGHAFEDAGSYANGDSAADHFICTRCGEHFDHTYY